MKENGSKIKKKSTNSSEKNSKNSEQMSDEDKQIEALKKHKELRIYVQKELKKKGIKSRETRKNDPRGDIAIKRKDKEKAKQTIRDMNIKYNPELKENPNEKNKNDKKRK